MNAKHIILFNASHSETDDDCACPDKAFSLGYSATRDQAFTLTANVHTAELPQGFHLAFSPYAPVGPSVLNAVAWERWQSFVKPQTLAEEIDHALAIQSLLCPSNSQLTPIPSQPYTLTAWLHVSNACNLDCPYCYVRKSSERMSDEVGLRAVESVFRSALLNGFRRVKLKYAGGEATLHFNLVRRLHERALALATETGLELKEVLLSNGTHLTQQDADWLVESGVKIMVSVDGVGEMHDRLRPQKNGQGSFDKVQRTVDQLLLPRNIRPDVTMTITRVNASSAADVAKWALIDRGLPTSFNFYRQNVFSASRAELALEENAIIQGMLAAYTVIEADLPTRPFFNGLLDRVQSESHSHTCGVGHSYVVVTHTGQLSQCQMHLDNSLGNNGEKDILPLVAGGPIHNISVDNKEGCNRCEFKYLCTGGCPLETYRATGRWDVKSPNCHIYKTLLPAALRLEGLRLLKQHGYVS
ncbi:MAG: SPASM domain-containing protein [Chloroflexi bacterium]|nr:SPASM domain-containing protein [Chloroflexota bacterium]